MSFFGFGEISFNNILSKESPLAPLFLNEFGTNSLRYPEDIGNSDKSHYIMFFARTQRNTSSGVELANGISASDVQSNKYIGGLAQDAKNYYGGKIQEGGIMGTVAGIASGAAKAGTNLISQLAGNTIAGMNNIFSNTSQATNKIIDGSIREIAQVTGASLNLMKTNLTTDTVILYMPDTLLYDHKQKYSDLHIGNELGGQALAALRSAADAHQQGLGAEGVTSSVIKSAAMAGVHIGGDLAFDNSKVSSPGTGRLISATIAGNVINPMLEMIYSSPSLRNFQFEFKFYPRSKKEALQVQNIIERFRYHQAPELVQEAQGFLIPPSEFDIKMYCNGKQNPNLPTIATCVLTDLMVDYSPDGFSAYEIQGDQFPSLGGTGMPVKIRLLLSFTETSYLTKKDFNKETSMSSGSLGGAWSNDTSTSDSAWDNNTITSGWK